MMWRAHPTYQKYEATQCGRVRHVSGRERLLRLDRYGYLRFNAWHAGKHVTIKAHSFVYECWNGILPEGLTIHHQDYDKANNRLSNMTSMTAGENCAHAFLCERNAKAHPVVILGSRYHSKRNAERSTGLSRFEMGNFMVTR